MNDAKPATVLVARELYDALLLAIRSEREHAIARTDFARGDCYHDDLVEYSRAAADANNAAFGLLANPGAPTDGVTVPTSLLDVLRRAVEAEEAHRVARTAWRAREIEHDEVVLAAQKAVTCNAAARDMLAHVDELVSA